MATIKAPEKSTRVLPVVVTDAITRTITELMATRREFNRSKLIRDALVEMADRDLPADWRETVGFAEESAA